MCDTVFRRNIDYVFVAAVHGNQSNVSIFLEEALALVHKSYTDTNAPMCYERILKMMCKYYMAPCGKESSLTLPVSVCPEECSEVKRDCPTLWDSAKYTLAQHQFIDCTDTTVFIAPFPHCCASASTLLKSDGKSFLTMKNLLL